MNVNYYIAKGQKTLGPCSLDDVRNFLAYGSIQRGDLIMRGGEEKWHAVGSLLELTVDADTTKEAGQQVPGVRRRTVRYRNYERVPPDQRAGVVLRWMILGFLFFPPMLWRAAVSICTQRIFRSVEDEDGYLTLWPRWMEMLVSVLIVMQVIVWWLALSALVAMGAPMFSGMMETVHGTLKMMRDLF